MLRRHGIDLRVNGEILTDVRQFLDSHVYALSFSVRIMEAGRARIEFFTTVEMVDD